MGEERISSVLVPEHSAGDRDRPRPPQKVLGAGLGAGRPGGARPLEPAPHRPAETPLYDAWVTLLDAGVHHLPVTRGDEIVGVLTSGDVLRQTAQGPVAVMRGVERLASRDSLPGYAARVTAMVSSLLAAGLDARRSPGSSRASTTRS